MNLTFNGHKVPLEDCRISAMPFNRVWTGKQRTLDQTCLAKFAGFDLTEPGTLEISGIDADIPALLYPFLTDAACDANRPYPRVECSDRVRYAVYPGSPRTLYILNTEEHLDSPIRIHWSENHIEPRTLKAGELVELEVHGGNFKTQN